MEGLDRPKTAFEEMAERDLELNRALKKMTAEQRAQLEKKLRHVQQRDRVERQRGTAPSAREWFEMRSQTS